MMIKGKIQEDKIDEMLKIFEQHRWEYETHMKGILNLLDVHPTLNASGKSVIHSVKCRVKTNDSLRHKIERKAERFDGDLKKFILHGFTDLCGIRALLLYSEDFKFIDAVVREKVGKGDWYLQEKPKAYTWDPEARSFFSQFDLNIEEKPSFYTSVHYLIKPKEDTFLCCELQVRTLFEEIWGEVDHQFNYPDQNVSVACMEQIKVLAKIVGAGGRLLDALRRTSAPQ